MSQAGANSTTGGGGGGSGINTLSAEHGLPVLPAGGNFDFSHAPSGAILFSTVGAGQMEAAVQVDNVTIQVNGSDQLVAIGGGAPVTLTPDSGGAISSVAANFNIEGLGGLTSRKNGNPNLQYTNKRYTTQYVVDPSSTFGSQGEYTTITAAVAAAAGAGGGQVFVRTGTYTESFTVGSGVSINAYGSAPNVFGTSIGVVIDGTVTLANNGEVALVGISITNSSGGACITTTGTNGFLAFVKDCTLVGGSGAIIQGSNGNANILFDGCTIVSTAGDFLNCTGAQPQFTNCQFVGAGGSGALTYTGGEGQFFACDVSGPISLSSGARISMRYCTGQTITTADTSSFNVEYSAFSNNTTIFTTAGTGNNLAFQCILQNSEAAAIDLGAGTGIVFDQGQINSSGGAFAVTGTGNFSYGLLEFNGAVQTIDPGLTINLVTVRPFATTSSRGLASFNPGQFTVNSIGEVSIIGAALPWTDETVTFSAAVSNGYFIVGAGSPTCELPPNLSFPASPIQGDTVQFAVEGTGATVVLQAETGQTIRIANAASSVAGTATSTLTGDSITLVYRAADSNWVATSFIGTWVLA